LSHQGVLRDLSTTLGRSLDAIQTRKVVLKNRLVPTGGIPEHLLN